MNRRATVAAIIAMLLPLVPFAGSTQPNRAEPYKIGVTYPLTGPLAPSGKLTLIAIEQSVDDINKAGGIKGRPLALSVEDTAGTPQGGVAAMRKLVQVDGVQAIITIYTNVVTAQIPLADQLKVPTLSTVESPGLVSKSQFSFAHSQTIANEAPLLHDYWKSKGYKRLAGLYGNNALGLLIEPAVKGAALDNGMQYTEAFFDLDATDYRGTAAKVKDFNPDAIFIAAQGSTGEQQMIKQVRELGVTAPMFSPSNTYNEAPWRAAVGSYADTVLFAGLNRRGHEPRLHPRLRGAFQRSAPDLLRGRGLRSGPDVRVGDRPGRVQRRSDPQRAGEPQGRAQRAGRIDNDGARPLQPQRRDLALAAAGRQAGQGDDPAVPLTEPAAPTRDTAPTPRIIGVC
jgi:ABC-type branched-subunit amino acid transport system substrate-binding protein